MGSTNINKKSKDLIKFWDNAFALDDKTKEEIKKGIKDDDYLSFAPSSKLIDAASSLVSQSNVLDYGCGTGWASIIMAKKGCKNVTAVDVSPNAISALSFYSDLFKVSDYIKPITIDEEWLTSVDDNKYDGIISSNVLDVIPLEITKRIIKEFARITTKDAKIVIGLNFYLDEEKAKERGMVLTDNELYVDGVLRLLNKKDEEWIELFSPYFNVLKLDYFAWPNEVKETRRLFILNKK